MINQGTKIAYQYVKQWITVQRERIDAAKDCGDHAKAIRLEAELRRVLSHGKH